MLDMQKFKKEIITLQYIFSFQKNNLIRMRIRNPVPANPINNVINKEINIPHINSEFNTIATQFTNEIDDQYFFKTRIIL